MSTTNNIERKIPCMHWIDDDSAVLAALIERWKNRHDLDFVLHETVATFEAAIGLPNVVPERRPDLVVLDLQIPYSLQGDMVPEDLLEGSAWRFGIHLLKEIIEYNSGHDESERIKVICFSASFDALEEVEKIEKDFECEVCKYYKLDAKAIEKLNETICAELGIPDKEEGGVA